MTNKKYNEQNLSGTPVDRNNLAIDMAIESIQTPKYLERTFGEAIENGESLRADDGDMIDYFLGR